MNTPISIHEQLRPTKWSDMAQGIDHPTVRMLRGYEYGKVPNAILAHGPAGTGKTSAARLFARALTCSKAAFPLEDPCGECWSCNAALSSLRWSNNGISEIDCARLTANEVIQRVERALIYAPAFSTTNFRGKVILLDEVHRNEGRLANRLLKIIEDSNNAVFFLMTTDRAKLGNPLQSRCLQVRFEAPTEAMMINWMKNACLKVGISASTGVIPAVCRCVEFVPRDAITLLSAANAIAQGVVTMDDLEVAKWNF